MVAKETALYDVLGIAPDATPQDIKKAYRKQALRFHPDKNPSPDAEEKFKIISEAYQVLIDENSRKVYDELGQAGIDQQKMQGGMDPRELFRELFGAGQFDDIFGELEIFNAFLGAMDPDLQGKSEEEQQRIIQENHEKMKAATDAKIKGLVEKLTAKVERYTMGDVKGFRVAMEAEANDMAEAPGGSALTELVGHIYEQEAKQHMTRWFGLQKLFSELGEKKNKIGNVFGLISSMANATAAAETLNQDQNNAQAQERVQAHTFKMIWRIGKIEIDDVVRRVCEQVLEDPKLSEAQLEKRALAVEEMGLIYQRVAAQTKREEEALVRAALSGVLEYITLSKFTVTNSTGTAIREIDFRSQNVLKAMKKMRNEEFEVVEGESFTWKLEVNVHRPLKNVVLRERIYSNFDIKELKKPGFGANLRNKNLGDFEPREEPYVFEIGPVKAQGGFFERGHYVMEISLVMENHLLDRLTTLYAVVERPQSPATATATA